ncbi:Phage tail protein [compost metagenome]
MFNRAPYNRPYVVETFFNVSISSLSEVAASLSADIAVAVVYEAQTEVTAQYIREIPYAPAIESATDMLAQMIRDRFVSAGISTSTELAVNVRWMHANSLTFTGGFNPGDKLIIDTKKQTITLNGVNVLHLLDGDFFGLIYGTNAIKYTDSESVRTILTRITHRDRYLY